MNRTLSVAAAGMATQQTVLDVISANLANVDVSGFRACRADFAPFISAEGRLLAPRAASERTFGQGRLDFTDNPNDLAIEGAGFFAVGTARGETAFTRAGDFTPDANGRLHLRDAALLEGVRLPAGTTAFSVDEHGNVRARIAGRAGESPVGKIRLASFANPAGLRLADDGLFYASKRSGAAHFGAPGGAFGTIKQRWLERANISVVGAMMAVLAAQRAYEANAKAVQAADEMLRLANNLERN